ncbi:MAG: outer membrane beta-barrel protein, partial [Sphingobacteriales bacterium]
MKSSLLTLSLLFFFFINARAQNGREVSGTIIDSTKLSVPGAIVKVISDKGDSSLTATDPNGKFDFPAVHGTKFTLSIKSIGYQAIRRHYTFDADTKPVVLAPIILKAESNTLATVNIVATEPVVFKEDTTQYKASNYPVRVNAPIEDVIKKLPGVDVDVNGNITTQGKQVTKVRINGKDFMGGDVQSVTKNLPADVVENIQMIDDYGDQANLTGIKTGEPDKIMNITIRKDKNYGYTMQATGGDGEDLLPKSQGLPNENRYLGAISGFTFNGDQQTAVLGSINNTNVNTFSFGSPSGGGFGGGGRGNAARGSSRSGSLITPANGITDAHSLGLNFRDQWGKNLSVYGSYSVADNTVLTNNIIQQTNNSVGSPTTNYQTSTESDRNINHRFTWNMEYKPDTINYLKVTPNFSYASVNTYDNENNTARRNGAIYSAYTDSTYAFSSAPTYGLIALYNHKFKKRHNLSINLSFSSASNYQYQNPVYNYTVGTPTAPVNQVINTNSRTNTYAASLSYLLPVGNRSYLEFNYAYSHSITNNDKATDTLTYYDAFNRDTALSNQYNYTFTTNRFGLNYRFIEKKYNLTLGIAGQPAVLDGDAPLTGFHTHVNTFNVIPTARFVYNFSRSHAISLNYNGSSSQPSFQQLQPVIDFSNALYPVEGNPDLKPEFTNNFSLRYNAFSFETGNVLFTNFMFTSIQNDVVSNTITYPRKYTPDPRLQNTILTKYLNANGYYTASGGLVYAKPWDNRKYTLSFIGNVTYSNNIGYLTNIDSITYKANTQENISKNLQLTPGLKFRTDITDVIDAQFLTNYAINRTNNSVNNALTEGTSNVRTWAIGLNGKNYFGDWTFSYDYTKTINYGYATSVNATNPNILNVYLERRFLKENWATIRLAAYDLFNQNTGFTDVSTASSNTETHVNRLARYYLATLTIRLQKFAGKA